MPSNHHRGSDKVHGHPERNAQSAKKVVNGTAASDQEGRRENHCGRDRQRKDCRHQQARGDAAHDADASTSGRRHAVRGASVRHIHDVMLLQPRDQPRVSHETDKATTAIPNVIGSARLHTVATRLCAGA